MRFESSLSDVEIAERQEPWRVMSRFDRVNLAIRALPFLETLPVMGDIDACADAEWHGMTVWERRVLWSFIAWDTEWRC